MNDQIKQNKLNNQKQLDIQIPDQDQPTRIDIAIAKFSDLSRRKAKMLVDLGSVFLDGSRVQRASTEVQAGQKIRAYLDHIELSAKKNHNHNKSGGAPTPELKYMDPEAIIYDDEHLIAINKPAGLLAQPGLKKRGWNVLDATKTMTGYRDLKPLHRLDKATTGITLMAKSNRAAKTLGNAFKNREVQKVYHAVTNNKPSHKNFILEDYLTPIDHRMGTVVCYQTEEPNTKQATTECRLIKKITRLPKTNVIECRPVTGRSHQIRAQLLNAGFPILGDNKYYDASDVESRYFPQLLLHAVRLHFIHPLSNQEINIQADHPAYWKIKY